MTTKPQKIEGGKKEDREKCKHQWEEDPMFACGAITMVCGDASDLGEETRVICKKCGETDYVRMKDLGSIMDIYNSIEEND